MPSLPQEVVSPIFSLRFLLVHPAKSPKGRSPRLLQSSSITADTQDSNQKGSGKAPYFLDSLQSKSPEYQSFKGRRNPLGWKLEREGEIRTSGNLQELLQQLHRPDVPIATTLEMKRISEFNAIMYTYDDLLTFNLNEIKQRPRDNAFWQDATWTEKKNDWQRISTFLQDERRRIKEWGAVRIPAGHHEKGMIYELTEAAPYLNTTPEELEWQIYAYATRHLDAHSVVPSLAEDGELGLVAVQLAQLRRRTIGTSVIALSHKHHLLAAIKMFERFWFTDINIPPSKRAVRLRCTTLLRVLRNATILHGNEKRDLRRALRKGHNEEWR